MGRRLRQGGRLAGWLAVLVLAAALWPRPAAAQLGEESFDPDQPVALVADRIDYDSDAQVLTATGNVEVYYGTRTLTADMIRYDDRSRRILAEGNLVLRDGSGATVFAEAADLDAELRDGLVKGAKAVLDRYSRLSAVEARRVEDRYNILSKAVFSPCEVCAEDPTPLWRIRARRVIHDQEARVIHYEDARFEVLGVPVAWTPYFSHPDPSVKRATGFLSPSFTSSSNFGYGVKTPYYWVIDDHSDLTLTPFLTTNDGLLGELAYRRAFETGALSFAGSVAQSDFAGPRELHGHVDTEGRFRFDNGIRWGWDVKFASDDNYLRYFDFSNEDRLTSTLYAERYRRDGFFDLRGIRYQSLRNRERAGQIPLVLPEFEMRQDFADPWAGGEFGAFAAAQALRRTNGEDTARLSVGLDWSREVVLPAGLALTGFASLRGDLFLYADVPGEDDGTAARFAPLAGVEARYPLIAEGFAGTTHVLEPIAQAVIAPWGGNGDDIPNEDSQITEFDELSLFDRSHFSGLDAVEEGPRLNLGIRYEVFSELGISFDATVGRVLRLEDAEEFSVGSGLRNAQSDWVGAWSASYDPYVTVSQRLRVADDGVEITRNEWLLALAYGPARVGLEYIFLDADPDIDAPRDREEVTARASVRLTEEWSVNGFLRRDLELGEFVYVGAGLRFANECCAITAFARRDFTETVNVPASTSFGVQVELFTLGGRAASFGG